MVIAFNQDYNEQHDEQFYLDPYGGKPLHVWLFQLTKNMKVLQTIAIIFLTVP